MRDYTKDYPPEKLEPFFPNEVLKMSAMVFLLLAFMLALVVFLPSHPEEPADRSKTPEHIKPEWYFLPAYQALKAVPLIGINNEFFGIVLQGMAVLVVFLLPFLDRAQEGKRKRGLVFYPLVTIAIIAVVALGIWGHYSR